MSGGAINKTISQPRALTINEIQYPTSIFTSAWTDAERKAIGILPFVYSGNNRNDAFYSSSAGNPSIGNNSISVTYTTTARNLSTVKSEKISEAKINTHSVLLDTDWYVVRKAENNTSIPSQITAFRTAVRTNYAALKTAITNAANVAAVEALWNFTAGANSNRLVTVNGTSSGVVNTSTNTITSNGHAFVNDEVLEYDNGGGADIGGLVNETSYYVYARTTNTFKLSHSHSNCGDAASISLSALAGSGTAHKFISKGIPGAGHTNPNKDAPIYNV